MGFRGWLVGISLFLVVGCGGIGGDENGVGGTGVPSWTSETAWHLEEDLRVGSPVVEGEEAPDQFGRIWSITSDSVGRIYVAEGMSQEIRVFYPDGSFSHLIGGEGSGPGEFTALRAMTFIRGDTLWVLDDGLSRYTAFTSDGEVIETRPRMARGFLRTAPWSFLGDGTPMDWGISFPDGRNGARTELTPILFDPGFLRPDSFPPIVHDTRMLPDGSMPLPYFGGELTVGLDHRGGIWFAHSRDYRIFRRTFAGDTTAVISLVEEPAEVGEAERNYIRTSFARRPDLASIFLESLPETKPIVRGILPDNTGHVLVFPDIAGAPEGTVVDVFEEEGAYLGRVSSPVPIRSVSPGRGPVVHVTPDYLFAVVYDSVDIPYVSRMRIVRGSR